MVSRQTLHDFLNILPAVVYEYVLYEDGRSELLYISPSSKDILGGISDAGSHCVGQVQSK